MDPELIAVGFTHPIVLLRMQVTGDFHCGGWALVSKREKFGLLGGVTPMGF